MLDVLSLERLKEEAGCTSAIKSLEMVRPAEIVIDGEIGEAACALFIQIIIANSNVEIAKANLTNAELDRVKLANARAALIFQAAARGKIDLDYYVEKIDERTGALSFVLRELVANDNTTTNQSNNGSGGRWGSN